MKTYRYQIINGKTKKNEQKFGLQKFNKTSNKLNKN